MDTGLIHQINSFLIEKRKNEAVIEIAQQIMNKKRILYTPPKSKHSIHRCITMGKNTLTVLILPFKHSH